MQLVSFESPWARAGSVAIAVLFSAGIASARTTGSCGSGLCADGCPTQELALPPIEVGPGLPGATFPDVLVPKFDPALGTLRAVRIQLTLTAVGRSFGYENLSTQPCTIAIDAQQACLAQIELAVVVIGPHSATTPLYGNPDFGTRHASLPNVAFAAFDGVLDFFSPAGPGAPLCPYVDTNVLENQGALCANFDPPGGDLPVLDGFGGSPTTASPGAGSGFSMCWPDTLDLAPTACLERPQDLAAYVGGGLAVLDVVVADQSFVNVPGLCNGNNAFGSRVRLKLGAQVTYVYCGDCPEPGAVGCCGDGSSGSCPCGNAGASCHGCASSANPEGAALTATGMAHSEYGGGAGPDTLRLAASGLPASATAIVIQGSATVAPLVFGDGLRCCGGNLTRLAVLGAVGGSIELGFPSERISVLGQVPPGQTACYQVYYRDASPTFCPSATFNVTNSYQVAWQ